MVDQRFNNEARQRKLAALAAEREAAAKEAERMRQQEVSKRKPH